MPKPYRWILMAVVFLFAASAGVFLFFSPGFESDAAQKRLETFLSQFYGSSVVFKDKGRLELWPYPAICFGENTFSHPQDAGGNKVMIVKGWRFELNPFSFLTGRVRVKRIILLQPTFLFERGADGQGNWMAESGGFVSPAIGLPSSLLLSFLLSTPADHNDPVEIHIENGSLKWVDVVRKNRVVIDGIKGHLKRSRSGETTITMSARRRGQPIKIEGKLAVIDSAASGGGFKLDISAAVAAVEAIVIGRIWLSSPWPRFDIDIRVAPFSPRRLLAAFRRPFPLPWEEDEYQQLAAMFRISRGASSGLHLNGVISLDRAELKFSLKPLDIDPKKALLLMSAGDLDLDRYLPPGFRHFFAMGIKKNADYIRRLWPFKALAAGGRINSVIEVEHLTCNKFELRDVRIELDVRRRKIFIPTYKAKLAGGNITGDAALDWENGRRSASVSFKAEKIESAIILRRFQAESFLEGQVRADGRFEFRQQKVGGALDINGNGNIGITNGRIVGFDLARLLAPHTPGSTISAAVDSKGETPFTALSVPFVCTPAQVESNGILLQSPEVRLRAAGHVGLLHKKLDLRITPLFIATKNFDQNNTFERTLLRPLRISGALNGALTIR